MRYEPQNVLAQVRVGEWLIGCRGRDASGAPINPGENDGMKVHGGAALWKTSNEWIRDGSPKG